MIKNKRAEINPIMLVVAIVVIGLFFFFILKIAGVFSKEPIVVPNVTKLDNATARYATGGGINVSSGQNVIASKNASSSNMTLITVVYPNSTLTPGTVMSTNLTEICTSGYSASVRDVSQATKDQVFIEYRLSPNQPTGTFEVDHLIPLELGGSNDITNLWPEPASPKPGFHEKDVLENYYHKQVCAGKMKLQDAQQSMATNWFQGYLTARMNGGIK